MMSNSKSVAIDDEKVDRFITRFLAEGSTAAVLGGDSGDQEKLVSKLIAQTFPFPLVQIHSDLMPPTPELDATLEQAMVEGRVVTIKLDSTIPSSLFRYLEQLIRDRALEIGKPQGWTQVACHDDFKLLLRGADSAPLLDSIPLKLRLAPLAETPVTGGTYQ